MFTRLVRFTLAPGSETKAQELADELTPLIVKQPGCRLSRCLGTPVTASTGFTFCGTPRSMQIRPAAWCPPSSTSISRGASQRRRSRGCSPFSDRRRRGGSATALPMGVLRWPKRVAAYRAGQTSASSPALGGQSWVAALGKSVTFSLP
jgi:hypothetical protein